MPHAVINGGIVVYEILGTAGELIVLTPGGRFGKDVYGLRPLAEQLVAGGHRVLLWDRPNCGASDVQFFGESESHMRVATLHDLLSHLGIGPCVLAGGSGGARDSILMAMLHPEMVSKLAVWNIVGGVYGTINLAAVYVLPSLHAVRGLGTKGLLTVPEWQERVRDNPANEQRLLSWDADEFVQLMLTWLNAFVPKPGQTLPGIPDTMFAAVRVPTLIIRGGKGDHDHPKRTSLEVNCLIEGSVLIEPPWPEDAWERGVEKMLASGSTEFTLFEPWHLAAPPIVDFLDSTRNS
ncbi:hydrolase [Mycobacterium sp. E802]|uniref:alpha/beta fold hydrolase n=1 Tax=Mycobacterium sp. E802 TaxID=1834152 RepID=UPI0007FF4226|nr:alpha/beta hydrolase [Mycobacterium sp. E802]OBG88785.1 hydrolase [Mycobacterium sp. E802]